LIQRCTKSRSALPSEYLMIHSGQKFIRANFQIKTALLAATAANQAPCGSTKTWCRDNKTAAQTSKGRRSARPTRYSVVKSLLYFMRRFVFRCFSTCAGHSCGHGFGRNHFFRTNFTEGTAFHDDHRSVCQLLSCAFNQSNDSAS